MIQVNLLTKQKQSQRHKLTVYRKQTYGYQRGKVRERDKLGYTAVCTYHYIQNR